MERTVLMVRPEQRAKLAGLAAREHVSAAEINRRAIDAYNPDDNEFNELGQLAEAVMQSHAQAMQAIKEAHKAVKETLSYFAHKKSAHHDD
jgi:nitrogenase subunit NifH